MTLAVATISGEDAFLFADLQLSYELEINKDDRPDAALKIIFAGKRIAVGYAGTTEVAHSAIKEAATQALTLDCFGVANFLREKCREHNDIEFLLVSAQTPVAIYKITPKIFASTTQGQFWIGDAKAADTLFAEANLDAFSLEARFQSLLDSRKFGSVGGIVSSARATKGLVKFTPKMALNSPYYVSSSENHSIDFGDAARGGFGYTTITPCDPGQNGWGVHFFQGFCGYFFKIDLSAFSFEKLVWRESKLDGVVEALRTNLGFDVEPCGKLGDF